MKLEHMRGTVAKYAQTISSILKVAVTVVDDSLARIGDTYPYPDEPMPVLENSVIGQAVITGRPLAVRDVRDFGVCKTCDNYENCSLDGVIAVPIFFGERIVGGFCLIVPKSRMELFDNVQAAIDFLENMAELLSEKMKGAVQLEALENAYREREIIMNAIEDAIVSVDGAGRVDYFNERFEHYFGGKKSLIGRDMLDSVPLPAVAKMLEDPYNAGGKLIYHKNPSQGQAFYGFVSCYPKRVGAGSLFAFRGLNSINSAFNEIFTDKTGRDFDWLDYHGLQPKNVLTGAKQLAIPDETILIRGERGVGRQAVAKAIHSFSDRSEAHFINVNCESISPELIEEELFGVDPVSRQATGIGKLRLAHRGTLFLSEVSKMPLYLQDRIARFMKTRRLDPDFTQEDVPVDVRVICSSSEDLRALVDSEHFSESLFYRISKNELHIPPLRGRTEQEKRVIVLSAVEFYRDKYEKHGLVFHKEAIGRLASYDWPGNLPQLWNHVERLVYCGYGAVTAEQIGLSHDAGGIKSLDAIEREQICMLLQNGLRKGDIAKVLNISRATLYRKLKKYNVS